MTGPAWPRIPSAMTAVIRAFPWVDTPLGPLDCWPQSLRTTVDNLLSSPYPMLVAWGDDLTVIYNAAYVTLLGPRHPGALGRPFAAVLPDPVFRPMVETVMAGETHLFVDQPYELPSRIDRPVGWFTGSWIPLSDEQGRIRGFQATVLDSTARVLAQQALEQAERHNALLLRTSDALRPLRNAQDIQEETCRILSNHFGADGSTCMSIGRKRRATASATDDPSGAIIGDGRNAIEASLALAERIAAAAPLAIDDTETSPLLDEEERQVFRRMGARAVLAHPLDDTADAPVAIVFAAAPRRWSEGDVLDMRDVAERARDALGRAGAETALRQNEERLRLAMEAGRLAAWDWDMETGHVEWTEEHYRQTGYAVGEVDPGFDMWLAAVHPEDRTRAIAAVDDARDNRTPMFLEYRILYRDSTIRWFEARGLFFYNAEGKPRRLIGVQRDVTETRRLLARQQALLGELQHRTRNLMGVVRSLCEQTLRTSDDIDAFAERFRRRLGAVTRAQGYLSRLNAYDRVAFGQVLDGELTAAAEAGLDPCRVTVHGTRDIPLRSVSVQSLALAIQELCADAAQRARQGEGFEVAIGMSLIQAEGRPWLDLRWHETSGTSGDGDLDMQASLARELVLRALPYQFSARTCYDRAGGGLACSILLPVSERQQESAK